MVAFNKKPNPTGAIHKSHFANELDDKLSVEAWVK